MLIRASDEGYRVKFRDVQSLCLISTQESTIRYFRFNLGKTLIRHYQVTKG